MQLLQLPCARRGLTWDSRWEWKQLSAILLFVCLVLLSVFSPWTCPWAPFTTRWGMKKVGFCFSKRKLLDLRDQSVAGDFAWLLGAAGRGDAARGRQVDMGHCQQTLTLVNRIWEPQVPSAHPSGVQTHNFKYLSFTFSLYIDWRRLKAKLQEISREVWISHASKFPLSLKDCHIHILVHDCLTGKVEYCEHFILNKYHAEAVIVPFSGISWMRISLTESHFEILILCPEQFCVFSSGCCALK